MKHITEEYGVETNMLEMESKDITPLANFLREAGIDLHVVSEYAGKCTVQVQIHGVNGYWFD